MSACICCVPLLLSVLLLGQLLILIFLLLGPHWSLPAAAERWLEETLSGEQVSLRLEGVHFDRGGKVRISKVHLGSSLNRDAIFEIQNLRLHFEPWSLLINRPYLRRIEWDALTCFSPSNAFPRGFRKPLLKTSEGAFRRTGLFWEMAPWQIDAGPARLRLRGRVSLPLLSRDEAASPWDVTYSRVASTLLQFFEIWGEGAVLGNIVFESTRPHWTQIQMDVETAGSALLWAGGETSVESSLSLRVVAHLSGNRFDVSALELKGGPSSLGDFSWDGLHLGLIQPVSLVRGGGQDTEFPRATFSFAVDQPEAFEVALMGLRGTVRGWFGQWKVAGYAELAGERVRWSLTNTDEPFALKMKMRGQNRMDGFMQLLSGRLPLEIDPADWKDPIHWKAEASWAEKDFSVLPELKFDILTGTFDFSGIRAQNLAARGSFKDDHLTIDRFVLTGSDYELEGRYVRDLATGTFRTELNGTLWPADLSAFFQPWWSELWDNFEFSGNPPRADFIFEGTFRGPSRGRLFGYAESEDFTFSGVPVSGFSGRIWAVPAFFELFDVRLSHPDGAASGSYAQTFNRPAQRPRALRFDLRSSLPLEIFPDVFGEPLQPYVAPFNALQPPELRILGMQAHEEEEDLRTVSGLEITGVFESGVEIFGNALDRLEFEVRTGFGEVIADSFQVELGGGQGQGRFTVRLPHGESGEAGHLDLNLALDRAHFRRVVQAFPPLRELPVFGTLEPDQADLDESNLSLSLDIKGDPMNWRGFEGKGVVRLADPELARLRLFGAFSRALEATLLPVGSFQFHMAQADLLFEPGRAKVSNFRMEGPSTRIEANGWLVYEGPSIDFDVVAFPFQATRIPLLHQVTQLLNPFSQILEFRLWGDLAQPRWRFALDPRNLFGSPRSEDSIDTP